MSWAALFTLTNLVALAAWAALAFLPRRPLVLSLVMFAGVGLLCLAYAAMLAAIVFAGAEPGRVAGAPAPALTDYSIEGIRALFMSDAGIVVGWTHYLAFDLFVGLWIARTADAKGFGRAVQLPVLFLTLMAGPIGLLVWLIMRERRSRSFAKAQA